MNYKSHKGFAREREREKVIASGGGAGESNSGREDFEDAANLKHAAHLRRVESRSRRSILKCIARRCLQSSACNSQVV